MDGQSGDHHREKVWGICLRGLHFSSPTSVEWPGWKPPHNPLRQCHVHLPSQTSSWVSNGDSAHVQHISSHPAVRFEELTETHRIIIRTSPLPLGWQPDRCPPWISAMIVIIVIKKKRKRERADHASKWYCVLRENVNNFDSSGFQDKRFLTIVAIIRSTRFCKLWDLISLDSTAWHVLLRTYPEKG